MSEEKGETRLEKMLRNSLISAYLDYVREFGEEKAQRVYEEALRFLKPYRGNVT